MLAVFPNIVTGGGVIITPLLASLTDLPQQAVLGTSLFSTIPPSLMALVTHSQISGNVDWRMSIGLALGCGAGSYCGSKLATEMLSSETLEVVFAVTMVLLGSKTIHSGFKEMMKLKVKL